MNQLIQKALQAPPQKPEKRDLISLAEQAPPKKPNLIALAENAPPKPMEVSRRPRSYGVGARYGEPAVSWEKRALTGALAIPKGFLYGILYLPQVAGRLIQEFGERMPEEPTYYERVTTDPYATVIREIKGVLRKVAKKTDIDEEIARWAQRKVKENQRFLKKTGLTPSGKDPIENFLFQFGVGASSLAGAIGLSYLTRNPMAAALAFGAIQKSQLYGEAREAGVSPQKAGQLSTLGGIAEGTLEYIGLHILFGKRFGSRVVNAILKGMTEGAQEWQQQFAQNVISKIGWDKSRDLLDSVWQAGAIGVILGVPAATLVNWVQEAPEVAQKLQDAGINPFSQEGEQIIKTTVKAQAKAAVQEADKISKEIAKEAQPEAKTAAQKEVKPETKVEIPKELEPLAKEARKYKTVTQKAKEAQAPPEKVAKEVSKSPVKEFIKGKELIGTASVDEKGIHFKGVRYGSETGDPRRGGTWYEIPAYEGAKSQYEAGKWYSKAIGVGGKEKFERSITLKNPYFFDWSGLGEGKAPIALAKEVLGEEVVNKLKKGITGYKAEAAYARIENAISKKLSSQGYDGVVFYDKIHDMIHPKQAFVFSQKIEKPSPEQVAKEVDPELGRTVEEEARINKVIEQSRKAGVPLDKLYGGPTSTEDIIITGSKVANALRKVTDKYAGMTDRARRVFTKFENKVAFSSADAAEIYKISPIAKLTREQRERLYFHRNFPQKKEYQPRTVAEKQAADFEENMNRFIQKMDEEKGIEYEKFPEAAIARLDSEIKAEKAYIERLTQKRAIERHKKKLAELEALKETVKTMGYIHHVYIASPEATRNIVKLFQRKTLKERLSKHPTGFTGRKNLTPEQATKWAAKHGFILSTDPLVSSAHRLALSMKKWAISDFLNQVKNDPGLIHPNHTSKNPAPTDWVEITGFNWQKALGKAYKNPRFEPNFARAINEYITGTPKAGKALRAWRELLFVTKTLVFYNPIRLGLNDVEQSLMAGVYSPTLKGAAKKPWRLLPFGNAMKHIPEAVRVLTERGEKFRTERELGLFSGPNFDQQNVIKIMQEFANGLDAVEPNLAKIWRKYMKPISVDLFKNIRKSAWTIDQFQRVLGVETLMARGMSLEDAVDRVKMFLADYSRIPNRTARGLSDFFLVPRYRISMGRLWAHIIRHPVKEREALAVYLLTKVFLRSLAYITAGSWVYTEFYRLKHKKDDRTEDILTLPGPLFELEKWMGRPLLRSLIINLNIPFGALISVAQNRDWRGKPICDENASPDDKKAQRFSYLLKTFFPPLGAYEYTFGEEKYIQPPEAKIMYHLGLYKYTRTKPLNRETYAIMKIHQARNEALAKLRYQPLTEKGKEKVIKQYERNRQYWLKYAQNENSWFVKAIEQWAGELPTGRIPILSFK